VTVWHTRCGHIKAACGGVRRSTSVREVPLRARR